MRNAIANMVEKIAVITITMRARMIERSIAPCMSPTLDGSSSLFHQYRLAPRMGKLVPPRRPWKDRMNIANMGP